eukprot:1158166-Pelagomonas_calceolata.AAC.4
MALHSSESVHKITPMSCLSSFPGPMTVAKLIKGMAMHSFEMFLCYNYGDAIKWCGSWVLSYVHMCLHVPLFVG